MRCGVSWFPAGSIINNISAPPSSELDNISRDELIVKIGKYVGLKMRDESTDDDDSIDLCEGNVMEFNGIWLLLYTDASIDGFCKSRYTLNLQTLRPTRNSNIQIEIPDDYQKAARRLMCPCVQLSHKKNDGCN